jgi:transposase
MTVSDWEAVLVICQNCLPSIGRKGADDRLFLEAMHFFATGNVSWRALPERFGNWSTVWKRFHRVSKAWEFEGFFEVLADMSPTTGVVQMFDFRLSDHR